MRIELTEWLKAARIVIAVALIVFVPAAARAGAFDWPRWRGPGGDAVSKEKNWKGDFGKATPPVAWEKELGIGYSAVSVRDGRVFATGYDSKAGEETLFCFDERTGKEHWRYSYKAKKHDNLHKGGAGGTPAVDDAIVYTMSRDGLVTAVKIADGKRVWQENMTMANRGVGYHNDVPGEFRKPVPSWGFANSPLVLGDHLIVDTGVIRALDKKTGETVWQTKQNFGGAYSSPLHFKYGGKDLIATLPNYGLVIVDATNGDVVATHRWSTKYGVNSATPVVVGNEIFISSGYNTGCAMLRFDGKRLRLLWENKNMRNKMSTCVVFQNHLYGFDEGRMRCLDWKTGDVKWTERGTGHGALMLAGDRLIAMGEDGDFIVAKANTGGYAELTRAKLFKEGDCWIMPVLANGQIYCRSSAGKLVVFRVAP